MMNEEIKTLTRMARSVLPYLRHPDVKRIPFALRSETAAARLEAAIEEVENKKPEPKPDYMKIASDAARAEADRIPKGGE